MAQWTTFQPVIFFCFVFVSLVLLVMNGAESTAPSPPLDVDLNQLLQVIHAQVRA